jgi:hypothetical protein
MANSLYTNAKQLFLEAGINWLTDTIKATLVKNVYIADLNAHKFLSDVTGLVPGAQNIKTLTGKTTTDGAADADNIVFPYVASGYNVKYVLIYKDTGDASTSPLIALIDTGVGLPLISTGGNIPITWDSGSNKIFSF